MNNKILFRGFHADENGETVITIKGEKIIGNWVYGYPVQMGKTISMHVPYDKVTDNYEIYMVIPKTVGQFVTTDKNGKDLFEGDIVKNNRGELMLIEWVQKYTRFTLTCKEKGIIISTFVPEQCELISNKWECAE